MLIAKAAGYILDWYATYTPLFVFAGVGYLVALSIIHVLLPKLQPATLTES